MPSVQVLGACVRNPIRRKVVILRVLALETANPIVPRIYQVPVPDADASVRGRKGLMRTGSQVLDAKA